MHADLFAQAPYRHSLGRAFTHAVMRQACSSYSGGTLRDTVVKGLPRNSAGQYAIPGAIKNIAWTFVDLQQKRHFADYDLSERFKRADVLTLIENAKDQAATFSDLAMSDDKKFFLACLWAWKELANR